MNKCVFDGKFVPADNQYSQHWYGSSKCITTSGESRYLIGISMDNYFRITLDGVELYNTKDNKPF